MIIRRRCTVPLFVSELRIHLGLRTNGLRKNIHNGQAPLTLLELMQLIMGLPVL